FRARSIPSISIHAYLTRILKYCPCANECFLAVLVYFDRMTKSVNSHAAGFKVDSYNLHRLLIAGVMVSSKLFSDVFFTNTRYAKVGGIPISELNLLEVEFLSINNYNLFISLEEMQSY
ncbi:cyclin PHO80-like protein, partial [Pilobolus umbonatus]